MARDPLMRREPFDKDWVRLQLFMLGTTTDALEGDDDLMALADIEVEVLVKSLTDLTLH